MKLTCLQGNRGKQHPIQLPFLIIFTYLSCHQCFCRKDNQAGMFALGCCWRQVGSVDWVAAQKWQEQTPPGCPSLPCAVLLLLPEVPRDKMIIKETDIMTLALCTDNEFSTNRKRKQHAMFHPWHHKTDYLILFNKCLLV